MKNNDDKLWVGRGKQLELSLDIWPVPTKDNVIGFSCVQTMVVSTLIVSTYNCV